mgnify:CR=1 FL=1
MSNSLTATNRKEKILALLSELETKGDIKNSGIEGIKTTLIALGGAIVGKKIGRPSLLLGIGTIAAGHYFDSKRLVNLGVGITAGGGIATAESLKGTDETLAGKFKSGLKEFGQDLKHRLYVDKFIKPKKGESTNGLGEVGEVQYFKYPGNELNMGTLEAIEDEIRRSSELMEQRQMKGNEEVSGSNEEVSGGYEDVSGVEEKIF